MHFLSRRTITSALLSALSSCEANGEMKRWVVYYSNKEGTSAFAPYDVVVLDSRYYPPLLPLADMGKVLIGYASVGEASEDYSYFQQLKAQGLLLRPSATWKGNYYIDIRDRRWHTRFCEQIVPEILKRGFHGIFLDTLDSPLHMESDPSGQYNGMTAAAVELIKRIRRENPKVTLMLNRAYSLLIPVVDDVDIAVGESVYSTYNFDRKEYQLVDATLYRRQAEWLQSAIRRRPALKVFTLDYWSADDSEGIMRIYREQRANGFCPYVSTIDLTGIVREPGI
jgi:polysaccharide biosynthesis protein PelA